MRGKKQGTVIAMRTAGCELKLSERQGEAVAPSAGRFKGARSAVQRQSTALLEGNWQAKTQENNTAACKEQMPAVEKELLATDKITV